MGLSISIMLISVFSFVGCFVVSIFCYFLGRRSGRREVIHAFDQVLTRIYQLTLTGNNQELHSFLNDVCDKAVMENIKVPEKRGNSETEGYI